jgi:uncharacterized RDD family membrane protein YckC/DNA-directed RNA polymerase subunit RPC12/RpoP
MPKTQCPNCQREDQVSALMAKMPILCKTCGTRVVVQSEAGAPEGVMPAPVSALEPPRSKLADFVSTIVKEAEITPANSPPNPRQSTPLPKQPIDPEIQQALEVLRTKGLAPLWKRFAARVIENLIITMAIYLPLLLVQFISNGVVMMFLWSGSVFTTLAVQVYFLAKNKSIGKALLGIAIYRPNGERVGLFRILVMRELVTYLLGGIPILDWVTIFGDERRCLHDRIADTIVLED